MLTELEERIVKAMCQNDLTITNTAKALHYSHNAVTYHINKIKDKTGHDLRTFYGAFCLLCMVGGVNECGYPKN